MAKVPEYGGFHTVERGGGAAFAPWSTDIPEVPKSDIGDVLGKAVTAAGTLFDKYLEEQDNARVTEALTDLRRKSVDMQAGENGYLKLLGANALAPDDEGRGLVERVDAGLQEYGSSLAAGLTPRQRKKFDKEALGIYQSAYAGVSQHVFEQGQNYQSQSAEAAILQAQESGLAYATRPDQLSAALGVVVEQIGKLARLNGLSPEQSTMLLRKNTSALYSNAVNQCLVSAQTNPSMVYYARALLDEHGKEMLASDVARLRTLVNTASDALSATTLGNDVAESLAGGDQNDVVRLGFTEAFSEATGQKVNRSAAIGFEKGILPTVSAGGHQTVTVFGEDPSGAADRFGASQLTRDEAKRVAEENGIAWDVKRFAEDRGYNMQLGFAKFSSAVSAFGGDTDKAFAAYFSDEKTVAKAQAAADKHPGESFLEYLPKDIREKTERAKRSFASAVEVTDANGKVITPWDPQYASRSKFFPTAEEARKELLAKDARCAQDPLYLEKALGATMGRIQQMKASYVADRQEAVERVTEALWQVGGDMTRVPADVMGKLTPGELLAMRDLAERISKNDQGSDPAAKSRVFSDDAFLVSLDERTFETYIQGSLSVADQVKARNRYQGLKQALVRQNDEARGRMQDAHEGKLYAEYVPSSDDVRKSLRGIFGTNFSELERRFPEMANLLVMEMVQELGMQGQIEGQKPSEFSTYQAVQKLSRDLVPVRTLLGDGGPAWAARLDELPDVLPSDAKPLVEGIAKQRLRNIGIDRDPTPRELQETLTRLLIRRDGGIPFELPNTDELKARFDSALGKKIREDWAKVHPNERISARAFVQAYVLARLNDVTVKRQPASDFFDDYEYGYDE